MHNLGPKIMSSTYLKRYAIYQWSSERQAELHATTDKLGKIVAEAFAYAEKLLTGGCYASYMVQHEGS